ncbi:hypothetical protein OIHEL45_06125 [Sulfitobacter indolifex HEL-45]|uniref:Uncharacterized protein n=1 Tax=Sulfitobacter indolifex HEL-45 TaxID=391624 RepID=A0ABP2DDD8_9RHOB|nr:hypothetical protein OIHEL45_06125 [Sulfitobacter indolifex HEL-45]
MFRAPPVARRDVLESADGAKSLFLSSYLHEKRRPAICGAA